MKRLFKLIALTSLLTAALAASALEPAEPEAASAEMPPPVPAEIDPASTAAADVIGGKEPVVERALPPVAAADTLSLAINEPLRVYVVPVTDQISRANLFILRRSIKQAIQSGAQALVLDMDTPGGRLDVTLEMMELLARFPGETLTFVNKDAISAGAYISMATDAIYFAPNGVMGAAAVVAGGGQEIEESMKAKINSYLLARMRSYTERFPYRGEVIRAMADLDFVLEIDGRTLKDRGELLSLTAAEAVELFGDPPKPLLASGIAEDIDDVLRQHFPQRTVDLIYFQTSWSEDLAKYLTAVAPVLLGIGLLALFIEFKTPGFGMAGIAGLVLVGIVFASNYVAGLAGMEALLFFVLGLALIVVEIFLLPGTLIFLLLGIALMLGALVWSLADVWPVPEPVDNGGFPFEIAAEAMWSSVYQVLIALAIAVAGLMLLWRFLPSTPLFGKLVHADVLGNPDPVVAGGSQVAGVAALPDQGALGKVTRDLHPLGEVEIGGIRYQATVAVGALSRGTPVRVVGYRNFCLLVEKESGV